MHSVRLPGRRRFRPGAPATVAVASLLWGFAGPAVPAQAAEITDGLATITPGSIGSGTTAANHTGKSVSTPDPYQDNATSHADSSFTAVSPWA
ncbi:hypothetical protein ACIHAR_12775 [Streptomyces sp. NPDC052016]|uniref:hypothetical protein n=1 Tax=Streptomyces sp. NPDC052016 TaxID=3365680 RepID=UPI0037D97B47